MWIQHETSSIRHRVETGEDLIRFAIRQETFGSPSFESLMETSLLVMTRIVGNMLDQLSPEDRLLVCGLYGHHVVNEP